MGNGLSDAMICWICLEEGPDEEGKPLMHGGCSCRGSVGYCHSSCLVSFATMKSRELECHADYKIVEIWMKCINCNQIRSGDMGAHMKFQSNCYLSGKLLLEWSMIAARVLLDGKKYGNARRLLVDLRPQACQLYGPEHSVTREIKIMFKRIDAELVIQRLRLLYQPRAGAAVQADAMIACIIKEVISVQSEGLRLNAKLLLSKLDKVVAALSAM